ncbi:hypothetical protein B0J13DRAFT_246464 [Dactylonectria estremocensis]|uniref:BZIP domain-containing protein n=1 Tax=Dactylonectria estremocensis TaxID=1079267 RepID=A0A9P9J9Q3_9HYPO|nr:hypothetical protein B0J13DRAFT_246464 [Dactylonectria estremocensis]
MPRSSPDTDPPTSTRKRSDPSDDGDEGGGKKRSRGRPRLDTKDETAADRRRTQIRLAQRAYRNRKDTAIDTLKQRVKELEQISEDMGREFMSLSHFVLGQGVLQGSPEVAQHLADANRKFLALQRQVAAEDVSTNADTEAGTYESTEGTLSSAVEHSQLAIIHPGCSKKSSSSSASSNEVHSTPNTEMGSEEAGLDNAQNMPVTFQQFNEMTDSSVDSLTGHSVKDSSYPIDEIRAQRLRYSDPFANPLLIPPPVPPSFAAQETTFGRRLQRTIMEAGYKLSVMSNPPPDRYMAVFSFCLHFESRREIACRLLASLLCTSQETLNNWKVPFTNLGGAGLHHFPSTDGIGCISDCELPLGNQGLPEPFKPHEMTGFSMGPFNPAVEATRDMRVDHRLRMLEPGFEGDFYDADEVEIYLRHHNIVIPANKDFVDAEIELHAFEEPPQPAPWSYDANKRSPVQRQWPPTEDPSLFTSVPGYANTSGNIWPGVVPPAMVGGSHTIPAQDTGQGTNMVPDLPTETSTNQFTQPLSFEAPEATWQAWEGDATWTRTKVTIDVNQLVAQMTCMAVCLGRTPGLRPQDIHKAVKQSIVLQH